MHLVHLRLIRNDWILFPVMIRWYEFKRNMYTLSTKSADSVPQSVNTSFNGNLLPSWDQTNTNKMYFHDTHRQYCLWFFFFFPLFFVWYLLDQLWWIKKFDQWFDIYLAFCVCWGAVYVMRCAIWYHLSNLKNRENTHGEVLLSTLL